MNRREFLYSIAGAICAGVMLPSRLRAESASSPRITINSDRRIGRIPKDFIGLSYESGQLAHPDFFDRGNHDLVDYFRLLGRHGVLRIGGNSSEFTVWNPGPGADLSDVPLPYNPDKTHRRTPITPVTIDNLKGFLDAVDWKLIYGLNLGMGTPEQAAEEAAYVAKAVGNRLLYVQIGNEPDLFHHNGLRQKDWKLDDYLAEWSKFADAVLGKTPSIPLAGPDVAGNVSWIQSMSDVARNRVGLLTGHYYAEGPPTNPDMTIERLLKGNPKLAADIGKINDIRRSAKLPYRMAETNSCYSGGKAGVSDTFASALWAADYMLQLAAAGFTGVNFHGGGNGIYTPIAGDTTTFNARPIYYGMLLAGQFAGVELVECNAEMAGVNAIAYAARTRTHLLLAIVNKDLMQPATVDVDCGRDIRDAHLWRLTAPAVDSKSGVTLAGAPVSNDGKWKPANEEALPINSERRASISVPAASAVLAFLRYA